ncbi:hypothetical protein ACOMHN_026884 [Nucella lapillus]
MENAKKLPVPQFLPTNANFFHHTGDTAVLECAVDNLGRRKVSWRKLPGEILTVGLVSFVDDERIEVEHPPGSSQWNLVIRDLQPEDAGVFECQISSKIKHLRHHVTLLVQNEPKEPKLKEPNIQITGADFVDEGEKIELLCNATAKDQPPEDLDWFREGNRLQTSDNKGVYIRKFVTLSTGTIVSILEIRHARLSDAGVYVCRTSSLDVTSFRVNVLNGDTYNVKRGSLVGIITSPVLPSTTALSADILQDRQGHSVSATASGATAVDIPPSGTEMDHTDGNAPHSAASETRHSIRSALLLTSVVVVFRRQFLHIT